MPSTDLESLLAQAERLTARPDADWGAAASMLERAIALSPEDRSLYRRLADCRRCLGDYRGAVQALDGLVRLAPKEPRSYVARSVMRWHLRDYAGAEEDAERALVLEPKDS